LYDKNILKVVHIGRKMTIILATQPHHLLMTQQSSQCLGTFKSMTNSIRNGRRYRKYL